MHSIRYVCLTISPRISQYASAKNATSCAVCVTPGVTTALLHQRCHWVLGIDKCWDPVAVARSKHPECRLERMDGFDIPALKALSPTGTFDKIFIDIGGIAELHVVMGLLGLYFRTFKAAYLVVKSKFLTHLMGQAQVWVPPGHQKEEVPRPPWRPQPPKAVASQQQQEERQQQEEQQQQQEEQQGQQCGIAAANERAGTEAQVGGAEAGAGYLRCGENPAAAAGRQDVQCIRGSSSAEGAAAGAQGPQHDQKEEDPNSNKG